MAFILNDIYIDVERIKVLFTSDDYGFSHNITNVQTHTLIPFDFLCKNYLVTCDALANILENPFILPTEIKSTSPCSCVSIDKHTQNYPVSFPIQITTTCLSYPTHTDLPSFLRITRETTSSFYIDCKRIYFLLLEHVNIAHQHGISLFRFLKNGSNLIIPCNSTRDILIYPTKYCLSIRLATSSKGWKYMSSILLYKTETETETENETKNEYIPDPLDVLIIKALINASSPYLTEGLTYQTCEKIAEQYTNTLLEIFELWPNNWVSTKFTKYTIKTYVFSLSKKYATQYANVDPTKAFNMLIRNITLWDTQCISLFCLRLLLYNSEHIHLNDRNSFEHMCVTLFNKGITDMINNIN
jgi:hypothetical protein